jgi:hypothetical protein
VIEVNTQGLGPSQALERQMKPRPKRVIMPEMEKVKMGKKRAQKQEAMIEVREPLAEYARNKEVPSFFGQPMLKGSYAQIDPVQLHPEAPVLFYSHSHGEI